MGIYIFLYAFSAILFLRSKNPPNKWFFAVYIACLVAVAGFRDMIGGFDVYIYGEVYEMPEVSLFLFPHFEWGFKIYFFILRQINERREFMFIISSFIFLAGHSYTVKKWSPIVYFSLFIYFSKFFLLSFVYVRQGIAMAVAWYSIKYLIKGERWKFALALVVVFFFHKSGLIFIPIIMVGYWKFSNWQLSLLTLIIMVVALSPISQSLFSIVAEESGNNKLQKYVGKSHSINFFYFIETGLLIFLALFFRKEFYKERESTIIYNGFICYIYVILIALSNATFIRLGWYYYIFMALSLGYIFTYIKSPPTKIIYKTIVFAYFSFVFFRQLLTLTAGDLTPYKSIFQNFERNGDSEHYEYRQRRGIDD